MCGQLWASLAAVQVRLDSYKVLAAQYSLDSLRSAAPVPSVQQLAEHDPKPTQSAACSEEQACTLARSCLAERVARVQAAGTGVLQTWLEGTCAGDLAALMKSLGALSFGTSRFFRQHCKSHRHKRRLTLPWRPADELHRLVRLLQDAGCCSCLAYVRERVSEGSGLRTANRLLSGQQALLW